mmetsp:Transcript_126759/g.394542  ORF Transcript_126759/g.394542 Transcript_126759/m.394542 type:complete len:221 (+) Transcript_126759:303-965(+)
MLPPHSKSLRSKFSEAILKSSPPPYCVRPSPIVIARPRPAPPPPVTLSLPLGHAEICGASSLSRTSPTVPLCGACPSSSEVPNTSARSPPPPPPSVARCSPAWKSCRPPPPPKPPRLCASRPLPKPMPVLRIWWQPQYTWKPKPKPPPALTSAVCAPSSKKSSQAENGFRIARTCPPTALVYMSFTSDPMPMPCMESMKASWDWGKARTTSAKNVLTSSS